MPSFITLVEVSRVMRKPVFAYAKTKTQISFAVTAKLISTFVFATQIVQSLYFLNTKFQASSHLVWLCSLVCVGPGRKPRRPVFSRGSSMIRVCTVCHSVRIFKKHSYTVRLVCSNIRVITVVLLVFENLSFMQRITGTVLMVFYPYSNLILSLF